MISFWSGLFLDAQPLQRSDGSKIIAEIIWKRRGDSSHDTFAVQPTANRYPIGSAAGFARGLAPCCSFERAIYSNSPDRRLQRPAKLGTVSPYNGREDQRGSCLHAVESSVRFMSSEIDTKRAWYNWRLSPFRHCNCGQIDWQWKIRRIFLSFKVNKSSGSSVILDKLRQFNTGYVSHNLNFLSTMATDGVTRVSSFHRTWIAVDYIFFSECNPRNRLQLIANYDLPTAEECEQSGPIPNHSNGSDHHSVAAKFQFNWQTESNLNCFSHIVHMF